MRKHRFYIFVIAALAVVGIVFHGSATTAHTASPTPARLGIGDLTGSNAASSPSDPMLNGYSVALASLTVPLQAAQQQQAAQAQQAAQQQQAAQAQQAAQQQAAQQQAAQAQQAAQQQAAQQQAAQQQLQQLQAAQAQQAAKAAQAQQAAQSAPAPAASSTSDDFARLRQCESGGNYSDNTGNGYYGAYQFSESTWQGMGFSGLPSDASPGQQDQAAEQLQAQDGWSPWPSCSAQLGLS